MEPLMEEEEYNWREVKLPSMIPVVAEPELERETGSRRRGRDILIAVDHGPNSKHAFDWAVVHLARIADTIHLIHAVSSKCNWLASFVFVHVICWCMFVVVQLFVLIRFEERPCVRGRAGAYGEAFGGGF